MTTFDARLSRMRQGSAGSCSPCATLDCLTAPEGDNRLAALPAAQRRRLTAGRWVDLEDLGAGKVGVGADGAVCLERALPDGRRQILDFRFRGDLVCRPGGIADIRAVALTDGILMAVDRDFLGRCRRHRQGIDDRALAATDYGFAKAVAHAVTLGQFSASERLASFLAEMGARLGCAVAGGTEIDLPMTRDDIADYLGLTSETVSRQFRRLKDAGLIRLPTPSRLVVPDMARLAARAPALAAGGLSSGDERSIA